MDKPKQTRGALLALGALPVLVAGLALELRSEPKPPVLTFQVADGETTRWTLDELKAKLSAKPIEVRHPFAQKPKKYEAFALADVLDLAYGSRCKSADYSDLTIGALDGYQADVPLDELREGGAWLAFRDLDVANGWQFLEAEKADPAPFLVAWTGEGRTPQNGYAWPWAVARLSLVRFDDRYPDVAPQGVSKDSPEYRGFLTFRNRCLACHSISQEGGTIGPDLNEPMSVTEYRDKKSIESFIREPSKFRYTQMPDHLDLRKSQLDELYAFFKLKSKQRPEPW